MTTLVEALTEQFQFWLGETALITPQDVANMLAVAQAKTTQEVAQVKISIEGNPKDVALTAVAIKQILKVSERKPDQSHLHTGLVWRELEIQDSSRKGADSLQPKLRGREGREKMPALDKGLTRSFSEQLIYDAVITLACGLLEFPTTDEGRGRKFSGPYPETFKEGMGKLSAYFMTKGVIIADALEYWRILSRPLKEWPSIPPELASEESLIDYAGRTTLLTERLAQKEK